jgi:O-antigen ligase
MELFLVKIVALFRPIASAQNVLGSAAPDLLAIGLFLVMVGVFAVNSALRKSLIITSIDMIIMAMVVWCISIYAIYFEVTKIKEVAKLLIPLLSYMVTKNILRKPEDYKGMLFWMIAGFSVTSILSAGMILAGKGVAGQNYWTGVVRWEGVYPVPHDLGHAMAFFLVVIVIYISIERLALPAGKTFTLGKKTILAVLAGIATYCLYKSEVRSALLGLLTFLAIYLYSFNRRLLFIGGGAIAVIAITTFPIWKPVLLPDVVQIETPGQQFGALDIGSGRPRFWLHNLRLFAALPIDQKLAGVGIGNKAKHMYLSTEKALESHNDWLDLLIQTGIVGLALMAILQGLILRAILNLRDPEKHIFLGIFIATNIMMFVSNSYLYRLAVSQTYYMVLAYIEARPRFKTDDRVVSSLHPGVSPNARLDVRPFSQ